MMNISILSCSIVFFASAMASSGSAGERVTPEMCSYEMQIWNVNLRGSVQTKSVRHPYADLTAQEIDQRTGCTVCSEDQVEISIPSLQPFFVCHSLEPRIRAVISGLVRRGAAVRTIKGYHVIKSRGPVNGNGDRTEFSNHAYGTAIDIDPEQNGLYDNCVTFGPQCRLLRGGEWKPGAQGSLMAAGDVVWSFKTAGFKWGGEIAGKQKDFMHFSLTGY